MRIKLILLLACCFFTARSFAQHPEEAKIKSILQEQNVAWNKGDIDAFMEPYWHSDSLMFIGKNGVTYGWQATLDNYKRSYPDADAMGKLTFTFVQFKPLDSKHYFVVGKWHLARSIGDVGGHFTLLWEKINGRWVIIADHSS